MKRRQSSSDSLNVHLPKSTCDAIHAMADTCDISPSAIVSALLAKHVDDMLRMAAVAAEARGTAKVPFDDVCDLLAHLWMETAVRLSLGTSDEFPWRTGDDALRNQWAEDLQVFKLRRRISAIRQHEPRSED